MAVSFAQTSSTPTAVGDVVTFELSISDALSDVFGTNGVLNYDADVLSLTGVTFVSPLAPLLAPPTEPADASGPQSLDFSAGALFGTAAPGSTILSFQFSLKKQGITSVSITESIFGPIVAREFGGEVALPAPVEFTFQVLPVANDDTAGATEDGGPISIDLLQNDEDEGDTLTVTDVTDPANGTVSAPDENGVVTYTPDPDFSGDDAFQYTITDSLGATDTATVTVTVTGNNDAPVAQDDVESTPEDTPVDINVLANDEDADNDDLTVTVGEVENGEVIGQSNGVLTFQPDADFVGDATIEYTISDGFASDSATVIITVNAVNDPPIAKDDSVDTPEDVPVVIAAADLLENDDDVDDENDTLTITAVGDAVNGTVLLSEDRTTITFTPDGEFSGDGSFTYTVSDPGGETDTANVTVDVISDNDDPDAVDDFAFVDAGAPRVINVLANDSDPEDDNLSIIGVTNGAGGSVEITPNGDVEYTPNESFVGADSFTYTITDGEGGVDTATVTVNVNGIALEQTNSGASGAGGTAIVELRTLAGFSSFIGANISLSFDPTALALQDIEYADGLFAPPFNALPDPVVNDGIATIAPINSAIEAISATLSGALTYATFIFETLSGGDSEVKVSGFNGFFVDGNGETVYDGAASTTVIANNAPVATNDGLTINEDADPTEILVLDNDVDADGDEISIDSFTQGQNGTVALAANGLSYTPNLDFNGVDTFTYEISDGNGGVDSATVTVMVNAVNDIPVAADDTLLIDEDADPVEVFVLENDDDADDDTLTINSFTQATNGKVVQTASGLSYEANENFNGTDSFTYTISDGNGGFDVATVNITVNAVNDGPDAVDDTLTIEEDAAPTEILVLGNDDDVEDDPLTITGFTEAMHGTVVQTDDGFTYEADDDFNGTDSFTYTISDSNGGFDTATVSITVNAVNDAPELTVSKDSVTFVEGTEGVVVTASAFDVDEGDTIEFSLEGPQGEFFDIDQSTGEVTFVSPPDFVQGGSNVFAFTIIASDGVARESSDVSVTLLRDIDGDTIPDIDDNAVFFKNEDQRDTDGDGVGNRVDADFNQDGWVDVRDFVLFRNAFGATEIDDENPEDAALADVDLNGDGEVGLVDFAIFRVLFGQEVSANFGEDLFS